MKLLAVDNYISFECIGGNCPISCCGGDWGIPIDDESFRYYMSVEGEFGDVLKSGITRMNGTNVFRLDEQTRDCVFLNENKLCSIYRNLGPDSLCETCRTYPRAFYHVGDLELCYMANSCPEVNRMIMQRKEPFNTLFDDSEGDSDIIDDYDIQKFRHVLKALTVGIHIIQNREITIKDRLIYLIFFVSRFQELTKENRNPSGLIAIFAESSMYMEFLKNELSSVNDYGLKIHAFMLVFRSLMQDSYDHPMWQRCNRLADIIRSGSIDDYDRLEKSFLKTETEEIQMEFEQLMSYRFFSVFMKGYDDQDYLEKLAYEYVMYAALNTYIALNEYDHDGGSTQEDRILFVSLCGRIEHANKRKNEFVQSIREEGYYEVDKLLRLIL